MKKVFLTALLFTGLIMTSCDSDIINDTDDVVLPTENLGEVIDLPNGLRVTWQGDKYMSTDNSMAFTVVQVEKMMEESSLRAFGLVNTYYRWSDRTVPYKFADGLSDQFKARVRTAWEEFNTRTCVKVREATHADREYVLVTSEPTGIWSYVGRVGGVQGINLQDNLYGTFTNGDAICMMMQTVGFYGNLDIRRPDRDKYITILWENTSSASGNFFEIPSDMTWSSVYDFGGGFDYNSILLPNPYAFSKNGRPTIVSNDPNQPYMPGQTFSERDIIAINTMYGCR